MGKNKVSLGGQIIRFTVLATLLLLATTIFVSVVITKNSKRIKESEKLIGKAEVEAQRLDSLDKFVFHLQNAQYYVSVGTENTKAYLLSYVLNQNGYDNTAYLNEYGEKRNLYFSRANQIINDTLNKYLFVKKKYDVKVNKIINGLKGVINISLNSPSMESFTQISGMLTDIEYRIDDLKAERVNFVSKINVEKRSQNRGGISIYLLGASVLAIMLIGLFVYSRARQSEKNIVSTLNKLNDGDFDNIDVESEAVRKQIELLTKELTKMRAFTQNIVSGQLDNKDLVFNEETSIGQSLAQTQKSLLKLAEEDKKQNKINEGLASLSELLGSYSNDLGLFTDQIIHSLIKFLGANQGAVFVVEGEGQNKYLKMSSCFAYEKKKFLEKKIKPGQGLAGQVWIEGKSVYMTEIPDKYVNITSGLGYSTPKCILIVPLKFNEQTYGIIELASFKEFEQYELDFVYKAAESIASAISAVKTNVTTNQLLENSKKLTQQMMEQEEEMRQNMEEMQATSEAMRRKEDELVQEIDRLKRKLKSYEI